MLEKALYQNFVAAFEHDSERVRRADYEPHCCALDIEHSIFLSSKQNNLYKVSVMKIVGDIKKLALEKKPHECFLKKDLKISWTDSISKDIYISTGTKSEVVISPKSESVITACKGEISDKDSECEVDEFAGRKESSEVFELQAKHFETEGIQEEATTSYGISIHGRGESCNTTDGTLTTKDLFGNVSDDDEYFLDELLNIDNDSGISSEQGHSANKMDTSEGQNGNYTCITTLSEPSITLTHSQAAESNALLSSSTNSSKPEAPKIVYFWEREDYRPEVKVQEPLMPHHSVSTSNIKSRHHSEGKHAAIHCSSHVSTKMAYSKVVKPNIHCSSHVSTKMAHSKVVKPNHVLNNAALHRHHAGKHERKPHHSHPSR